MVSRYTVKQLVCQTVFRIIAPETTAIVLAKAHSEAGFIVSCTLRNRSVERRMHKAIGATTAQKLRRTKDGV